jgi:hypothetical protein
MHTFCMIKLTFCLSASGKDFFLTVTQGKLRYRGPVNELDKRDDCYWAVLPILYLLLLQFIKTCLVWHRGRPSHEVL